jgi:zinc transport system substrate-binding protein
MKRLLLSIGILLIFLAPLSATGLRARRTLDEGKITVVSVIFPSYDFVQAIAGDRVNHVLLTAPGAESHTFEPSPRDIITIRNSDLFIYTGGHGDRWMDRILDAAEVSAGQARVLKLMDMVEVLTEEYVEGMQHDHHECDEYCDDLHEPAIYDEHVWTSPRNARLIIAALAEALSDLDSVNAAFYRQNAAAYIAQLDEIDAAFQAVVNGARRRTILVADRFPFRYLAHHYGLEYYAAFSGCSTQSEPSAATVAFLINRVRSAGLPVVFHMELGNENLARTIARETGTRALLLHSAHNLTTRDFSNGVTYLDIQRNNVEALRAALW